MLGVDDLLDGHGGGHLRGKDDRRRAGIEDRCALVDGAAADRSVRRNLRRRLSGDLLLGPLETKKLRSQPALVRVVPVQEVAVATTDFLERGGRRRSEDLVGTLRPRSHPAASAERDFPLDGRRTWHVPEQNAIRIERDDTSAMRT